MQISHEKDENEVLTNFTPSIVKLGISIGDPTHMKKYTSNGKINVKHLNFSFKIKYEKSQIFE